MYMIAKGKTTQARRRYQRRIRGIGAAHGEGKARGRCAPFLRESVGSQGIATRSGVALPSVGEASDAGGQGATGERPVAESLSVTSIDVRVSWQDGGRAAPDSSAVMSRGRSRGGTAEERASLEF